MTNLIRLCSIGKRTWTGISALVLVVITFASCSDAAVKALPFTLGMVTDIAREVAFNNLNPQHRLTPSGARMAMGLTCGLSFGVADISLLAGLTLRV
ncbi:MAG: hypothetical protein EXS31_00385 [Pedosphaera sp.]|nr:hypothetical protein [Pedosphaera sp.]